MTKLHNKSAEIAELSQQISLDIKRWGHELGFQQVGITDCHLDVASARLKTWLQKQFHGEMHYMARHGVKRTQPEKLVPNTIRIISVRMNYLPVNAAIKQNLANPNRAYVSRYAVGADYHKIMRKRLQCLAEKMVEKMGPFGYRAFADSAPVLEKPIAEKAGLGWIGKHTNLINRNAGSWFFLGTLYTDIPLLIDDPIVKNHCGQCRACIDICPTQAIVGPYQLDARRCISYLTIELKGSIPEEFRHLIGNRIYGCDDCQVVCPWNRFAKITNLKEFHSRHDLDQATLLELFAWSEQDFYDKTKGSAIRRIGYERWLRNIAIALGNAPTDESIIIALRAKMNYPSELVREHVAWALQRQQSSLG